MDAVATHDELARPGLCLVEMERDARSVLVDLDAAMAELDRVLAKPLLHGGEEHVVQIGAMDRELRPVVAGEAAARLLVDELAMTAVEGELARLDGARGQRILQAKFGQLAHGVRQQVDADSQRQDRRHRLEDAAGDSRPDAG